MLSFDNVKSNSASIFEKHTKDTKSQDLTLSFHPHPAGSTVWQTISQWLPPRTPSNEFWWQKTGPQFASLLAAAGYTIHQQYSSLLFHYHMIVPRLGPLPSMSRATPVWKTFMTDDYTPIEYSWKWDSAPKSGDENESEGPVVRYGFEALGPETGMDSDPLNQKSVKELLAQLDGVMPSVDLTWFKHFSRTLRGGDEGMGVGEREREKESSILMAVEFLRGEIECKIYFLPVKSVGEGGEDVGEKVMRSIRSLDSTYTQRDDAAQVVNGTSNSNGDCDGNLPRLSVDGYGDSGTKWQALQAMQTFLQTTSEGQKLKLFMLSIDLITPSSSRLKIYVRSQTITFDSVTAIMTLGHTLRTPSISLLELKELWRLTLGLKTGFDTSEPAKLRQGARGGMCYYFDIQQGNPMPEIKMYIPVAHYGVSDMAIAAGLGEFLEKRGRGAYVGGYMRALGELASREVLEGMCGVQTYIACVFQGDGGGGGLSLTCYLSPNVYREMGLRSRE